jgi:hypothetical protein
MLDKISGRRAREKVGDAIDALVSEPEQRGKPLVGDLKGPSLALAGALHPAENTHQSTP